MLRAQLAALAFVGFSACTHVSVQEVQAPDGTIVYEASCTGRRATFGRCMQAAAKKCDGPYTILERHNDGTVATATGSGAKFDSSKQILFKCGNASAQPKAEASAP